MTFVEQLPIILAGLFLVLYAYFQFFSNKDKDRRYFTVQDLEIIDSKKISNVNFNEKITTTKLNEDSIFFSDIIYKVRSNLDNSYSDPYEIESLADILIDNMYQSGKKVEDYLFPIYNHLCEFDNKIYTHFIGRIFERIAQKNSTSMNELSENISNYGTINLKRALFLHFTKSNLDYSSLKNLVLELINDTETIEEYSDILAISYGKDPDRIINLLNEITPKYNLLNIGNLNDKKEQGILKLSIFFFVKILIDSKASISNIEKIKELLFNKYRIIFDSLFKSKQNVISKKIRLKVYEIIEAAGIQQWRRGIGNIETGRLINNYFFVKYDKALGAEKVQRDQLEKFFKYFIELSNENFDRTNEGEFIEDALKMIQFGRFSINGYMGVITLHLYLMQLEYEREIFLDKIISKINENPIESNHFFLCIFLDNLLKTKGQSPSFYMNILRKVNKIVNPLIIDGTIDFSPFFYLDNEYFNNNSTEPVFNELVTQFFTISSKNVLENILPKLNYVSFLESKLPARFVAKKIFDLNKFQDDIWVESIKTFLATCYDNDKEFISKLIRNSDKSLSINEWQLVNYSNKNILSLHLPRSYQSKWNEFIINGFIHNKRIKYFLIRDLIGGLIQSNTVEEFSKEFRKFIIELTKSFFEDEIIYFKALNQSEVFSNTISTKDPTKAEFYNYE